MEFGNPVHGLRSMPVAIQRKNFDGQRVQLPVQCIDAPDAKEPATSWQYNSVCQRFAVQPHSESAPIEIQQLCTLPLAMQEILDSYYPGVVLHALAGALLAVAPLARRRIGDGLGQRCRQGAVAAPGSRRARTKADLAGK